VAEMGSQEQNNPKDQNLIGSIKALAVFSPNSSLWIKSFSLLTVLIEIQF
jgi:hypothetical protein